MPTDTQQKTIYFIRHGQSVANVSPVFQGEDSPLSEQGEAQAMTIASRLAKVPFDGLISSPLQRAAQTAHYIADKVGKDVVFSELFVEYAKPTELQGKPWSDQPATELWRAWQQSLQTPQTRVGDGENYDDIVARSDAALAYLLDRPESTLAVVTHAHILGSIVARVLYGDALTGALLHNFRKRVFMENTGLTVLRYKDGFEEAPMWRLWTLNDHAHFAE